ncbi:MAG: lytic transglycosylase domain-containing protein [Candidatus Fonsibacter ubiquis]|nr:lytic transglycosylase domain-containing protein [Candidatus Fonsibacter ubiquis]
MNFRFVIIINLFLLIGLTFPAYAKNIPPKLKPEKFIDKSVSSSKTSKLFDNITKNKKKDQVAITPKNDLPKEEELNQKKEIKKDIKEPKQKQTAEKEIVKSKETKEIKKNDEAKEIVPKIKPQDFKSFSPEHKGPLETKTLNNRDFEISKVVFDYVDRKQWKLALSDAQKMQDKTIYNLVNWMYLIDPQSGASFNEYFIFIKNNKDWPRINRIKYLAEHKINFDNNSPSSIIEYFNNNPPLSGFGRLRLAEAFLENNQSEKAKNLVKDGFKDAELSKNDLRYFSKIFKKFLTQQDYVLRADYFAYEAKYQDLRDTIEYLNADYQKLYNARAALFTKRSIARDKIQDKEFKTAYEILKDHRLKDGSDYAEIEWHLGWLALSFMNQPDLALGHFLRMNAAVSYPISKARAAFWIGKTYKKLGQTNQANTWFKTGSQYGTTFYGQLSHKEIDEKKFLINNSFKFSEEKYEEFKKNNPLAKSVVILKELNRTKYTKDILRHLGDVDQNKTAEEISMAGVLAQEIERYDFAIQIAKNASYKNLNFLEISYPRIEVPQQIKNQKILDSSVILALIRQESEFDTSATSRVGAKGLMQIMPATARLLSKVTNIDFSREKLTKDKDYNLALGSYYISDLDDLFGSHYLAFAAYNAGPNRVEKWIKTFGDPRRKQIDAIDFIELIPFHETRNYVQRVSENINVYEYLKDPNNATNKIEKILYR